MAELIRRDPTVVFLHQLLEELQSGQLRIPPFQRPFVWEPEQQVELLRSVRDGIPMGAVLVWETEENLPAYDKIGHHTIVLDDGNSGDGRRVRRYVLDGLQRLTTMLAALVPVTGEPASADPPDFVFDLADGNFTQVPVGTDLSSTPQWLPTRFLLDDELLLDWMEKARAALSVEQIRTIRPLARAMRAYKVPVITFSGGDLGTAARIMKSVNREGTRMSDLHMVHALSWRQEDNFNLTDQVDKLRASYEEFGWSRIKEEAILHAVQLSLGLDAQDEPQRVVRGLAGNRGAIGAMGAGFKAMAGVLAKEKVLGPETVPYGIQPVILAALFAEFPELCDKQADRLRAWFWLTTYWRTLFGRPKVRSVYEHLKGVIEGKHLPWPQRKWKQYEPLPSSLTGFSARVKALGLLLAQQPGADGIALDRLGLDAMPRLISRLPGQRGDGEGGSSILSSPGNRVLVVHPGEVDNLRRTLENPATCIPELCAQHLIPESAAALLHKQDYAGFIRTREQWIGEKERAKEEWARRVFFQGAEG